MDLEGPCATTSSKSDGCVQLAEYRYMEGPPAVGNSGENDDEEPHWVPMEPTPTVFPYDDGEWVAPGPISSYVGSMSADSRSIPKSNEEDSPAARENRVGAHRSSCKPSSMKEKGCCSCGVKTHTSSFYGSLRPILESPDVHKGLCIKCYPYLVPLGVLQKWQERKGSSGASNLSGSNGRDDESIVRSEEEEAATPATRPGSMACKPTAEEMDMELAKSLLLLETAPARNTTIRSAEPTDSLASTSCSTPPPVTAPTDSAGSMNWGEAAAGSTSIGSWETSSNGDHVGMPVATKVSDEFVFPDSEGPVQTAMQGEDNAVAHPATRKLEATEYLYIGIILLALVVAALAVVVWFGVGEQDDRYMYIYGQAGSIAPSAVVISQVPSAAPTSALDPLLTLLAAGGGDEQWKAFTWMSEYTNLSDAPDWRRMQLFALATFYYAFHFEDPSFPAMVRLWLDYDRDECEWYSSYFEVTGLRPCNERNEIRILSLTGLDLRGLTPFLPPELALLTSLEAIDLADNNINASLAEMIPDELSQLESLTNISLANNSIFGAVPASLANFTALEILDLSNNDLTGTLPSELIELTQQGLTILTSGNNLEPQ